MAPLVLRKPPDTLTDDVKLTSTFQRVWNGFEVTWNILTFTTLFSWILDVEDHDCAYHELLEVRLTSSWAARHTKKN